MENFLKQKRVGSKKASWLKEKTREDAMTLHPCWKEEGAFSSWYALNFATP